MSDPKPNRNKGSTLPKDSPTRNVVYCIKISNRDLAALRQAAAEQGKTPSWFAREAIRDRVGAHTDKIRAAGKTEPKSDSGSPPA